MPYHIMLVKRATRMLQSYVAGLVNTNDRKNPPHALLHPIHQIDFSNCNSAQLEKSLASLEVGVFVGLGLWGKGAIRRPKIDQRLHRL